MCSALCVRLFVVVCLFFYGWNIMGNCTSWIWIIFIITWIFSDCTVWSIQLNDIRAGHGLDYSRDEHLLLRNSIPCQLNPSIAIPLDITLTSDLKRFIADLEGVLLNLHYPQPSFQMFVYWKTKWTCCMWNVSRMYRSGRHAFSLWQSPGWMSLSRIPRLAWTVLRSFRHNQ